MSLFRNARPQRQQQTRTVAGAPANAAIAFKAGRMNMEGTTVKPMEAKGVVYIAKDDTNLPTFYWKNRTTGTVEEEIIVFPGNQKVYKCKSAPSSSRVFYLKLNEDRHFFWMQEEDAAKDDELLNKLNQVMNDERASTGGGQVPQLSNDERDMLEMLVGGAPINRRMMRELLQQMPAPPVSQQHAEDRNEQPATPQQQQQGQSTEDEPHTPAEQASQTAEEQESASTLTSVGLIQGLADEMANQGVVEAATLMDLLAPENVEILLADDEVVARLLPFLPNSETATREDILSTIRSPQYIQSLQSFTSALESDMDEEADEGGDDETQA